MSKGRITLFVGLVLLVWGLLHGYVFWRISTLPWIIAHTSTRSVAFTALTLWLSYPLARFLNAMKLERLGVPLEFIAATWTGMLFLLFAALVLVDLVTGAGILFPTAAPHLQTVAVILAALGAIIGVVQAARAPRVQDYEMKLPGLPAAQDGLTLVVLSDLHLGTLNGARWLRRRLEQVARLQPDLVVIVGDLVDGNVRHVEPLLPQLQQLRAPLGVWAVTGNHEYYAGLERSVTLLQAAGFQLLRDRWVEVAPGLILAGVDDLTARREFGTPENVLEKTLANRPPGATILLSHSPLEMDRAAAGGVKLMLSGHTHAGQIWPFNYLVRLRYPYVGGPYELGRMRLIVCRGTGTWGPPMRLWRRSEMLRIRLKAA